MEFVYNFSEFFRQLALYLSENNYSSFENHISAKILELNRILIPINSLYLMDNEDLKNDVEKFKDSLVAYLISNSDDQSIYNLDITSRNLAKTFRNLIRLSKSDIKLISSNFLSKLGKIYFNIESSYINLVILCNLSLDDYSYIWQKIFLRSLNFENSSLTIDLAEIFHKSLKKLNFEKCITETITIVESFSNSNLKRVLLLYLNSLKN